ncbi:hypothetical protein [Nocardia abscessus]|uniref:hypothetical protein n=1 Tax=Nocardia abscessus TaxID=120957 RepID=UPI0024571AC8|nr:hypothetical protein [Nocardia abscessus]
MRELAAHLLRWHAANTVYVLATVVRVTGSAPPPARGAQGGGGAARHCAPDSTRMVTPLRPVR